MRKWKFVFATLIFIVLFSLVPIHRAMACSGSTCSGLDPIAQGCTSSAYTVRSGNASGGGVTITANLRYSTSCVANWAQTVSAGGSIYLYARVYVSGDQSEQVFGTTVYTDMLNGNVYHCAAGGGSYNYESPANDAYKENLCG